MFSRDRRSPALLLGALALTVAAACGGYQAPPGPPAVGTPEASDQQCSRDSECVLVQDCCGCTQGGLQLAVHRDSVERLESSASSSCSEVQCAGGASAHRSCEATSARCLGGRCIPNLE
jgi:hypothetical protein